MPKEMKPKGSPKAGSKKPKDSTSPKASKTRKKKKKGSKSAAPEPEPEPEPQQAEVVLSAGALELLAASKARWTTLELLDLRKHVDDIYTANGHAATIARVAANNPSETAVDWSYKDVCDDELGALMGALVGNKYVKRLDFRCNKRLTDDGARPVLAVLPQCAVCFVCFDFCDGVHHESAGQAEEGKARYDVDARYDGVSRGLRSAIKEAVLPNLIAAVAADDDEWLVELDLHDMGLADEHMEALAEALTENTHVTKLKIGGNRELTDVGLRILLAALPRCSTLLALDLSSRQQLNETLTDEGVSNLLVVLPLCHVAEVNLRYCERVSEELKLVIADCIALRKQQDEEARLAAVAAEVERVRLSFLCDHCVAGGFGDPCDVHARELAFLALEAGQKAAAAADEEQLAAQ